MDWGALFGGMVIALLMSLSAIVQYYEGKKAAAILCFIVAGLFGVMSVLPSILA